MFLLYPRILLRPLLHPDPPLSLFLRHLTTTATTSPQSPTTPPLQILHPNPSTYTLPPHPPISPTRAQLTQATALYTQTPPRLLFSATQFKFIRSSLPLPEVAFLGRSNVGKSSLLNALFGFSVKKEGKGKGARVSSKPGRTRSMNFWEVGPADGGGRLCVLDMPGYGHGSQGEWGVEVEKYLEGRKQLKRAFLLVNAEHGLKANDVEILSIFRRLGVSHQVILSKADRIRLPTRELSTSPANVVGKRLDGLAELVKAIRPQIQPGLCEGPEAVGEVIACSVAPGYRGGKFGVEEVRWATLVAAGLGGERMGSGEFLVRQVDDGREQRVVSQEELVVEEEEEDDGEIDDVGAGDVGVDRRDDEARQRILERRRRGVVHRRG